MNKNAADNRRLAQWRVTWLIEHSTSHQHLWCIDSFVLQNPPLRQAPKRKQVKTIKMITREQILINKVTPNLPIIVYPEKEILGKLRENFTDESISQNTELEIHSMLFAGDMGGITCEIRTLNLDTEKQETVFLCSLTHFRVKRGQSYYEELEKYRIKRIRKLQRQNKSPFF